MGPLASNDDNEDTEVKDVDDDAAAAEENDVNTDTGCDGDGDRDGQLRGNWNCHPEEDALRKTCGSLHLWRAENGQVSIKYSIKTKVGKKQHIF